MFTSKFYSSIKLLGIAHILILTACTMPATQKRKDGGNIQGSFFADEVTGSLVSEKLLNELSVPKERVYAMKVCLRDLKYSKPVLNHPFLIEEIKQEIKTDATGCLNWTEKVEFEFLTEPVFIKMERKIVSKGLHTGSYLISFAINPWDTENYHNAIDLTKNKVEPLYEKEEATARLAGKSINKLYDLWVEDGRLFVNDEKMSNGSSTNFELKYEFNVAPYIKTQKTNGEMSTYLLKHGLFAGRIEVIHRYFDGEKDKNLYDIIASGNFNNAKMEKGVLSVSKILAFRDAPPASGSLFVRLHLRPTQPIVNLKPYVGVFPSGDFRNLRTNLFLKVLPSSDFIKELEAELPLNKAFAASTNGPLSESSADDNAGASKSNSKNKPLATWSSGNIDFASPHRGIIKDSHKKQISYGAHICYQNNLLGGAPIAFQTFKVFGFTQDESRPGPEKKGISPSNKDGCIFWTDTIEYDLYECRRYFKGYVIIENPDSKIREKRYYYVNPWNDYFGAKDENELKNKSEMLTSCHSDRPKKSEIVLGDISFKTHDFEYANSINSLLEFDAPKRMGITLHPQVKIPSDVTSDFGHNLENLIDGAYILRVMITKNIKLFPKIEVLAQQDIPVMNRNGQIYGEFIFRLKDHRLFHTRNTLFVQLLPIKNSKLEATTDYSLRIKKEFENSKTEDLIDHDTSLINPVYSEEIVIDGENQKTLRAFSGSEYVPHMRIDFKDANKDFNFSKLVDEFKTKQHQKERKANKDAVTLKQYAEAQNLDLVLDTHIRNLPFSSWLKNALAMNNAAIDAESAKQLCQYWFQHYWQGKFDLGEMFLQRACSTASQDNIKTFFDFDHIYFIKSVNESKKTGIGPEKGISLGTSFAIGTSDSASYSHSTGAAAKIGAHGPGWFKSLGAEVYHGIDYSRSTSLSDSNSTALSEGTNLLVTETQMRIQTSNYDYCLSIKPNARLFQDTGEVWYRQLWYGEVDYSMFFKSDLTTDEKLALSRKGMMICRSTTSTRPTINVSESYYWIKQPLSANEIQDSNDERNQLFSIMIRGRQDYDRFKFFLTKKWSRPTNALQAGESKDYLNTMIQMRSFRPTAPSIYVYREAR